MLLVFGLCFAIIGPVAINSYKYGPSYETGLFSIALESTRYGMTVNHVKTACAKSNAAIATYQQMDAAWISGFEECNCGWLSNSRAYYPIYSNPAPPGCGGYHPQIVRCTHGDKFNGYCYSSKKQCYKKFSNTNSRGGALVPARVANNLGSCKTFCTAHDSCLGFDYRPSTKECWQFTAINPQQILNGVDQYLKADCNYRYSVGNIVGGVFHIELADYPRYSLTFDEAKTACKKFGTTLATYKQLETAWRDYKMDMCKCGFLADGSVHYPITTTLTGGCGGSTPGIRSCGPKIKSDAYCYRPGRISPYNLGTDVGKVSHLEKKGLRYDLTFEEAKLACKEEGMTLATYEQLEAAYKLGMDECRCGWISDGSVRYPITKSLSHNCGGMYPGIRKCGLDRKKYDAFCYRTLYSVGKRLDGVFHLTLSRKRYGLTFEEAKSGCAKFGAILATKKELETAWRDHRMDVCRCGFLEDGTTQYPITTTLTTGCGGFAPGIRSCGIKSQADAYCFGYELKDELPPGAGGKLPEPKATDKVQCKDDSCLDGETCTNTKNSYVCTCPDNMAFNSYSLKCEVLEEDSAKNGLGCYTDSSAARDLDGSYAKFQILNPKKCMDFCKERRYMFAGVQAGAWCMCGNTFGRYDKVEPKYCSATCVGDSKYQCGEILKNFIYKTGYKACQVAACPADRRCVDTDNGYWCSCKKGYVYNDDTGKCQEFNQEVINKYYDEAFKAVRMGQYKRILNFKKTISPIFNDVLRICREEDDRIACEIFNVLESMKIQAGLVRQLCSHSARYVVTENTEGIDLKTYIKELQAKSIASNLKYDITQGLNKVLEENKKNFKAIGERFSQLAKYDRAIANADKDNLIGAMRNLNIKAKTTREKILRNINAVLKGALIAGGIDVATKAIQFAYELSQSVVKFCKIFPEVKDENEILGRAAKLAGAVFKVNSLRVALAGLPKLGDAAKILGRRFAENDKEIAIINSMFTPDGQINTDPETVANFIEAYGSFTGGVSHHEIRKLTSNLWFVLNNACTAMESFTSTGAVTAVMANEEARTACTTTDAEIAAFDAMYQEIFTFQFKVVKTYAKIVGGNIAGDLASKIGAGLGTINMYELVQGIILDQTVIQTATTMHCNLLEYENGGIRSKVCENGYFPQEDINVIVSLKSAVSTGNLVTRYATIPTTTSEDTEGKINMKNFLTGSKFLFSVPRDASWLVENGFITFKSDLKIFAYYLRSIEPYLPNIPCVKQARIVIETGERTSLFPDSKSTTYVVSGRRYGWEYTEEPKCASNKMYKFPGNGNDPDACRIAKTIREGNDIFPALFTETLTFNLKLLKGSCTKEEIDEAVKKIKHLPVRVTYKTVTLPEIDADGSNGINRCWPNPCQNGGTCSNDYENLTFKCACPDGASGQTCSNIQDHCAKKKCPGGTCINRLDGGICVCGTFQHYDTDQKRCLPSNCKSMEGTCGKEAKCIDTNTGPTCQCSGGQIFYAQVMGCRNDWCKSRPCGAAICTNVPDRAVCTCGNGLTYDPASKSCKNYCPTGACPSDSTCKVGYNGIYPKKDCVCKPSGGNPRIYWREKNLCQFDWCKYVGEGHIGCGQERCRSDWLNEVCLCNDPQKFVASRKKCETQSCWTKGWPQHCGNYYPVCKNEGNQVCGSWVGGCWGSSKQFRCCNFCS